MDFSIRKMCSNDWESIAAIYNQGIKTKIATFSTKVPDYDDWDEGHLNDCRFVAVDYLDKVLGWIALSPINKNCAYKGVAEISIYIDESYRGNNIGKSLIDSVITASESIGTWTLQSSIIEINVQSIALHKKCGFRIAGIREKIGCDANGIWQNTIIMERRSKTVGVN